MSAAVDAGTAWTAWTAVTPVVIAPAAVTRYVRVALPQAIAPDADGGYPSLRVVDAQGGEVPFALDPERAPSAPRVLGAVDRGFVPGRFTQAVFDLGDGTAPVDTIALAIDDARRPTYFTTVAIDASDDRRHWRIVRDDAFVYRVAQDGGRGNRSIAFSPTRSRWLRVRILDGHAAFPIEGATVDRTERDAAALRAVAADTHVHEDAAAHRTIVTIDPGGAVRPAAVAFSGARGTFARAAHVEAGDDGATWSRAGDGTIARYADGSAQLSFPFSERTARRWRVVVDNGDDAPLASVHAVLLRRGRAVVFTAVPGVAYRLLSGNDAAAAPAYDLAAELAHEPWRAAAAGTAATVPNGSFRDARPITERAPWLVTAALVAVAAVLGALALQTVRATRPS